MSDQMPDEVWIESSFNNDPNWPGFEREVYVADDGLIPGDAMRYIRADLYDSKPCPHVVGETTQHCALARDDVEALRAALMRIADYERNWMESGEVTLEDVQSIAREALGDD